MTGVAVFALSLRVFTAPDLCAHENKSMHVTKKQSVISSCHMMDHSKKADTVIEHTSHIPCDHMKQCLLDVSADDLVLQKCEQGIKQAVFINAPSFFATWENQFLLEFQMHATFISHSPPEYKIEEISIFLTKSSLLI